jgi:L-aspartate oxidase
MWNLVGLERDADGLRAALAQLGSWTVDGDSVADLEDRNLLELARLVATAALAREESRGAHDRTDFPETRPEWARSLSWRHPSPLLAETVAR